MSKADNLWGAFRTKHNLLTVLGALAVGGLWLFGFGPNGNACSGGSATAAASASQVQPATTPKASSAVAVLEPEAAEPEAAESETVALHLPVAKVYFQVNSSEVPLTIDEELSDLTAFLKENPSAKALISGFHDATGSLESNQALAKNRADSVSTVLTAAGISQDQIEFMKPSLTEGTGEEAEARRVEVTIVL